MVENRIDADTGIGELIMCLNSSVSWYQNKLFLAGVALVSLSIALFFLLLGAWPILPFAGLELAALAVCVYRTALRAKDKEALLLDENAITLVRGRRRTQRHKSYSRESVFFDSKVPASPLDKTRLLLRNVVGNAAVEIGQDLSDEEKAEVLPILQKSQLDWNNRNIDWLKTAT